MVIEKGEFVRDIVYLKHKDVAVVKWVLNSLFFMEFIDFKVVVKKVEN